MNLLEGYCSDLTITLDIKIQNGHHHHHHPPDIINMVITWALHISS